MEQQHRGVRRPLVWVAAIVLVFLVAAFIALAQAEATAKRRWEAATSALAQLEEEDTLIPMEVPEEVEDRGFLSLHSLREKTWALLSPSRPMPAQGEYLIHSYPNAVFVLHQQRVFLSSSLDAHIALNGVQRGDWLDDALTRARHRKPALGAVPEFVLRLLYQPHEV